MTGTAVVLFLSACGTAILHALIPDHWLPFAVMAKTQRWTMRRTLLLAGSAGLLHVAMSIVVAAFAIAVGRPPALDLALRVGRPLESITGTFLLLFGAAYGAWAYRRERRAHAGHAGEAGAGAGPGEHVHAHGHLLERWFRRIVTGGALVVIIGVSPCAILAPILLVASTEGRPTVLLAAGGFALCTVGTMVAITAVAYRGIAGLDLPFLSRYGDLLGGAVLAAVGIVLIVLH